MLSEHPLKAEPTSKLGPTLKLYQVAWVPAQSSFQYIQGWSSRYLPGALVKCLTIFMVGNLFIYFEIIRYYHYPPCSSLCLLALITTNCPEEPDYSCSTPSPLGS